MLFAFITIGHGCSHALVQEPYLAASDLYVSAMLISHILLPCLPAFFSDIITH
jgi:hypothetical protein